ncbi:hypothetical protein [Caproicibacter sp.]|uniref:hypothetical protein n=1 Tax=Caproicibacter sp. TaxID=2814884 RepID=UPI003989A8BF
MINIIVNYIRPNEKASRGFNLVVKTDSQNLLITTETVNFTEEGFGGQKSPEIRHRRQPWGSDWRHRSAQAFAPMVLQQHLSAPVDSCIIKFQFRLRRMFFDISFR